jgi:hypothetical protein
MRIFARAALVGCLAAAMTLGQQPRFDAASVKVVKLATHPVFGNRVGPGTTDPGGHAHQRSLGPTAGRGVGGILCSDRFSAYLKYHSGKA